VNGIIKTHKAKPLYPLTTTTLWQNIMAQLGHYNDMRHGVQVMGSRLAVE